MAKKYTKYAYNTLVVRDDKLLPEEANELGRAGYRLVCSRKIVTEANYVESTEFIFMKEYTTNV